MNPPSKFPVVMKNEEQGLHIYKCVDRILFTANVQVVRPKVTHITKLYAECAPRPDE